MWNRLTTTSLTLSPSSWIEPSSAVAARSERGFLLARYDVELINGRLGSSRRLNDDENGANVWFAYVEPNPPSEWFNAQTYVDTLNKDAIQHFINLTYEVYKKNIGNYFGGAVPSIFSDEPQFGHKTQLNRAEKKEDVFLPWSLDLLHTFQSQYKYDLADHLPELIWDLADNSTSNIARYHYHDHVCERFVSAFMDPVGEWCRKNYLLLTGHMMREPTLTSQTAALGEAMRCYRSMDIPGIDLLCDGEEYNTAKQAVSVARQNGAMGAMSELYGVTGWTFTFEGHKGCGDWQAALGITHRVHHLTHVSIKGEAKRDYPASIGYQSPWYKEYSYIEDYFARVNVALTRGQPVTRVAIIHPIESFWLNYGPIDTSYQERAFRDEAFDILTKWMLYDLVDFDFISESLFPEQTPLDKIGKQLPVGLCTYDAVILPNLRTIRSTTLDRLRRFATAGGKVIIAGTAPSLVDAATLTKPPIIEPSEKIEWSRYHILKSVDQIRDLRIIITRGKPADSLLYQLRRDGDVRFLFICNTDRKWPRDCEVSVRGSWVVNVLDSFSGNEWIIKSTHNDGWTSFHYAFEGCASLLLRLDPVSSVSSSEEKAKDQVILRTSYKSVGSVKLLNVELSEPNVLLLDYAQFKLNENDWSKVTEVLRIDNIVRKQLGVPLKKKSFRQPWSISEDARNPKGVLTLRFEFVSNTVVGTSLLAIEKASEVDITLDGVKVPSNVVGWWVDEDINTVELPEISTGSHVLELTYNYGILTNLERVYILGDFDISLRGRVAIIMPSSLDRLTFGDYTNQGLPFYAGNVLYRCGFESSGGPTVLELPSFHAPVVTVELDGSPAGNIALEPHLLDLGEISTGHHELKITSFGNRENAFGPIHLVDGRMDYIGPDAWRTEWDWWQDEYNLCKMGLLQTPRIKEPGSETLTVPRQYITPYPTPYEG